MAANGVTTDFMDMGDGYIVPGLVQKVEDGEFRVDYWTDGFDSDNYFDLSIFWKPTGTNFNKHKVLPAWIILE